MYSVEDLILKILKHKSSGEIDEIKVDLQRVCTYGFGSCQEDIGYIEFLYKHYSQEISKINNMTLYTIVWELYYGHFKKCIDFQKFKEFDNIYHNLGKEIEKIVC